uniref:zinc-binding protein A33-like n=1 Tax=Myxine glutinosa TaxID=7769 RepID=UPI00358E060B
MASSYDIGDILEILTCPVCFDLYKEPVALPCGHSFCRVCLETSWENGEEDKCCVCPHCREVFPQKPKLKKNLIIANFVEKMKFKKRKVELGVDVRDIELGDVNSEGPESHCQLCYREAAKRCVPCAILCCEQHLKPHKQKRHKLVDPGVNIEELRCIEYGKPIQLYCKDDGSLICVTRTGGEHQNHNVVAVEISHTELKGVLAAKYPLLSESMQSVASQLQQVQEEEQKTEGSNDLLKRLETLSDFKLVKTLLPVLDFSKEEKNLDVLINLNKNFPEKIKKDCTLKEELLDIVPLKDRTHGIDLKETLTTVVEKNLVSKKLNLDHVMKPVLEIVNFIRTHALKHRQFKNLIAELDEDLPNDLLLHCTVRWLSREGMKHLVNDELNQNNLRNLYGRTLSLDPNSANPSIKISRDLRTATLTGAAHHHHEHPDRFDRYLQVVSSESFSSGRHYWEIDIRKYSTRHNKQSTDLSVPGNPERFGFFLDCEAAELTCFWDSQVLHVFRWNFMDPVKPAIGLKHASAQNVSETAQQIASMLQYSQAYERS